MKKFDLRIKNRVLLGFILIGVMLLLSGVVTYFEFGRMSKIVSQMVSNNITCVNTSRIMVNKSDEYNTRILEIIGTSELNSVPVIKADSEFITLMDSIQDHLTTDEEKAMADSVRYAYVAYMHVIREIDDIWHEDYSVRRDWYFDRLHGVYNKMKGYIQGLSNISQNQLSENYSQIKDGFYRATMPGIVAIIAGIILVLLFNYFLNLYVLNPIWKMEKELLKYHKYNKPYNVIFDPKGSHLYQLNEEIKEIVDENKSLKKK
ncbi:MAG: MCP four helix bundle domain-containing protein [Bacteroidales bacterium]